MFKGKPSSLLGFVISDEGKEFYKIDTRLTMILSVKPLRWKKKVTKATTTMTNVSTNVDTMWKPICGQFCKKITTVSYTSYRYSAIYLPFVAQESVKSV